MAKNDDDPKVKPCLSDAPQRFLPFLEVICTSSGKVRRFAAGTEAGFAVELINKNLDSSRIPFASHIEAVNEGEEPVSFGPTSVLVDYGSGWKLRTVILVQGLKNGKCAQQSTTSSNKSVLDLHGSHFARRSQPVMSLLYIAKILVALVLIFAIGAAFTLALENLPRLIVYIQSSV